MEELHDVVGHWAGNVSKGYDALFVMLPKCLRACAVVRIFMLAISGSDWSSYLVASVVLTVSKRISTFLSYYTHNFLLAWCLSLRCCGGCLQHNSAVLGS